MVEVQTPVQVPENAQVQVYTGPTGTQGRLSHNNQGVISTNFPLFPPFPIPHLPSLPSSPSPSLHSLLPRSGPLETS